MRKTETAGFKDVRRSQSLNNNSNNINHKRSVKSVSAAGSLEFPRSSGLKTTAICSLRVETSIFSLPGFRKRISDSVSTPSGENYSICEPDAPGHCARHSPSLQHFASLAAPSPARRPSHNSHVSHTAAASPRVGEIHVMALPLCPNNN